MMGRHAFVPTEADRRNVKALAGYGIPEPDICKVIVNPVTGKAIDPKTLRKNFRTELDTGHVMANSKVAENLFKIATSPRPGAVTAAIFWLKVRAHWKETVRVEATGPNGGPIAHRHELSDADLEAIAAGGCPRAADPAARSD